MSTINRVNGLVSGFDTETLVKDLMKLEKTKTDKVLKDTQALNWQKDSYKEIMSLFRGFQSDYLDVLKPASNLRSKSAFSSYTAGAKISGVDTSKVSVLTSSGSIQGNITIDKITQLATKDTWISGSDVKPLQGTAVNLANVNASLSAGNNTISITLDGTTKSVALSAGSYADMSALVTDLNAQIRATFGETLGVGRIVASDEGGTLKLSSPGHTVVLGEGETGVLANLGFSAGATNALSLSSSLASAFGVSDSGLAFTINGVSSTTMGITSADTIQSMVQKVNASSAGVTMNYSTLTNGFTMKANSEGFANNISLTDTAGFFSDKLKLSAAGERTQGLDAEFIVNGITTTRSNNKVVVDGTTIQLKELSDVPIDITINPNTAPMKDNIVKFVNRYNELIEKVSSKLNEKKYRDYAPLTDEEKTAMSEDNIKLWEEKAKSGLIKGDGVLTNLLGQLRMAFGEAVSGSGITLREMGITTSTDYKENGKLIIDESKLDDALINKSAEVTAFFTNESSYEYGDSANRGTRYSQNGLAARVNDILNDNIRITRDNSGRKGLLVEKAGYEKASTDISSDLAKKITALESRYAVLLEKMNDTESRYYAKFTAMESALSKMNAQSTSLSGMFSSSSS